MWYYKNDIGPHMYLIGQSTRLQFLGMVTKTLGLAPALLVLLESITTQRHFEFYPKFSISELQCSEKGIFIFDSSFIFDLSYIKTL